VKQQSIRQWNCPYGTTPGSLSFFYGTLAAILPSTLASANADATYDGDASLQTRHHWWLPHIPGVSMSVNQPTGIVQLPDLFSVHGLP